MSKFIDRETNYFTDSNDQHCFTSPAEYNSSPFFGDKFTEDLYNKLKDVPVSLTNSQAQLQQQASTSTKIKSHLSRFNRQELSHLLDNCLITRGVSLKEDTLKVTKSHSFSIIKATKTRKKTLTEQQFQAQPKQITREIVYAYNYQSYSTTLITNQKLLSTQGSPYSDTKQKHESPHRGSVVKRKISLIAQSVGQNYKFRKFEEAGKDVVTTTKCDLFNCMDVIGNQAHLARAQIQLVSRKIKALDWQPRRRLKI